MADLADVTIPPCALPDRPADERAVAADAPNANTIAGYPATTGRDGATANGTAGSDGADQRRRRELRRELVLRALI
jgi:hypothetical protein